MNFKRLIFIPILAFFSLTVQAQEECDTSIPLNWCSPAPCKYRYAQNVTEPVVVERLPKTFSLTSSCSPSFVIPKLPINNVVDILMSASGVSTNFLTSVVPIRSIGKGAPVASVTYTKWNIGIPPNCMYSSADNGTKEIPEGWPLTTYSTNRPLPPSFSCSSVRRNSICGGSQPRSGLFDVTPGNYVFCQNGCSGPNARYFTSGQSGLYYSQSTAYDCNSVAQNRLCTDGYLSGSATYDTCLKRIDGVCGGANGSYSYSGAGAGACAAGTSSGVWGTWSWTCYGINGGTNASCNMYRNVDCSGGFGGWGACNGAGVQYNVYSIYQYPQGQGAQCPYPNGYTITNSCVPRVDCYGSWGACTCVGSGFKNSSCSYLERFTVTTPASGGGAGCSYASGATRSCSPPPSWD